MMHNKLNSLSTIAWPLYLIENIIENTKSSMPNTAPIIATIEYASDQCKVPNFQSTHFTELAEEVPFTHLVQVGWSA